MGDLYLDFYTSTLTSGETEPPLSPSPRAADEGYPLVLTMGRVLEHEHWHTGTMTLCCDVLDALVPHGKLEINPQDAAVIGIEAVETVAVRPPVNPLFLGILEPHGRKTFGKLRVFKDLVAVMVPGKGGFLFQK